MNLWKYGPRLSTYCSFTLVPSETRKKWTPESNINPHKHVEGDIELPVPEAARTGMVDEKYRWPKGKVPYTFSPTFREYTSGLYSFIF